VIEYAWLIPILPIAAAFITTIFGRRLPQGGAPITIAAVASSLVLSFLVFLRAAGGETHQMSWTWIALESHTISMGILVDNLSAFLALLVSAVALLIVIYSWAYMGEEGTGRRRYYSEVGLFIGAMLGTVLADNFLLMFLFWEIMGLCSYLLIGYWFRKPSAAAASLKAFLVTRIGDVMLLIGIIILFVHFGTFDYRTIFAAVEEAAAAGTLDTVPLFFAGLMIFGGAVGKSAQFPLHVWLPDAMEGPTTVSALIHAATMVKAGVFIVARSFPIFLHAPEVFIVVGVIGGITAFIAATMALVMDDIKRVLAYSTISQLGFMFLGLGAGGIIIVATGDPIGYAVAIFHLMTHAVFKALLFLGAGSVGHAMHHAPNPYDMRQMGGLHTRMKATSATMLIGSLAIAGVPPLSGFWSKDEILAVAFKAGGIDTILMVLFALALLTAFMTAFYMFRMWFRVFWGEPRSKDAEHAHESPRAMTVPLMVLAALTLVGGFFFLGGWGGYGGMESYLAHDLETYAHDSVKHVEFSSSGFLLQIATNPLTYVSILVALLGIGLAYGMYVKGRPDPGRLRERNRRVHTTLREKYYMDAFTHGFARFTAIVIAGMSAIFDRYILDGVINGSARGVSRLGDMMRRWQTGVVTTYAATIIIAVAILLIFVAYFLPLIERSLFPVLGW
jgi:proton-translocating NADH-quinone oxidoreductase chain L